MSDNKSSNTSPALSGILSFVALVAAPAVMVIMLAYVGFHFLSQVRADDPSPEEAPSVLAEVPVVPDPEKAAAAAPAEAASGEDLAAAGKVVFQTACAACHGPDGTGIKAGPMLMAPSLVGSELLLHEDSDVPSLIILKGIQKQGAEYLGMMAALGAALDDQKIAAVLTYLRTDLGNSGTPITVKEVADAREKFADAAFPAGIPRAELVEKAAEK